MPLEMKNVSFRYPNGDWILKNVSLSIEENSRIGLVAPSGYGKSTLAQILSGYLKPLSGEVLLDGKPLPKKGYCPVQLVYQHPEKALNPRLRLRTSLCEAWQPSEEFLSRAGIERDWLNRFPTELSGGELQRFSVVRALAPKTRYFLADEMTAMLDVITQARIWDLVLDIINERQLGLLVITHNIALAKRICNEIINLETINETGY